jgi:hypothetical protein
MCAIVVEALMDQPPLTQTESQPSVSSVSLEVHEGLLSHLLLRLAPVRFRCVLGIGYPTHTCQHCQIRYSVPVRILSHQTTNTLEHSRHTELSLLGEVEGFHTQCPRNRKPNLRPKRSYPNSSWRECSIKVRSTVTKRAATVVSPLLGPVKGLFYQCLFCEEVA